MEITTFLRRSDHADSDAEVSKMLVGISLLRIPIDQRLHNLQNLILLDARSVELVQSVAVITPTKIHVVGTKGFTHESDLGQPRPCASVGATSHTHDDAFLSQTSFLDGRFKLGDELR